MYPTAIKRKRRKGKATGRYRQVLKRKKCLTITGKKRRKGDLKGRKP